MRATDRQDKEIFIKSHVYDSILKHLNEAKNDGRERERHRVIIALRRIDKWRKMGEEEYAKRTNS